MNILITTPIFPPEIGGPAVYTAEVSKRLKARGHQIRVVAFTNAKPEVGDLAVIPVRLTYPVLGTFFRQVRLFFTVLGAARGMDLLYAQGPVVVGFGSLIVGKLLGKAVVVKFVGDIAWETAFNQGRTSKLLEDFLRQPEGGFYITLIRRVQKFVFRGAAKIITPSNYLRNVLVKYYQVPAGKIETVYNAVALTEVKAERGKYGHPLVITVGRLVPWKGFAELIELVPALARRYSEFRLMIVGDGPELAKLRRLCREVGAEPLVIFTGKVSHEQTLELLRSSDVFVLNSRYEGLPHTVIEAMACRCPVLVSDIEGNREVVADGQTGLVVKLGNKQELEEKLLFLLKNEKVREEVVVRAYENIKSRFTWESTLGKLEAILAGTLR